MKGLTFYIIIHLMLVFGRPICQFTASLYQEHVIGNVANNNILLVLMQVRGHDSEELLSTYKEVAKHYWSSRYG